MIRPSKLPMLAACACFESGPGNANTDAGTARHKAAEALLRDNDRTLFDALPAEDQEGVQWYVDYVRLQAPMSDYPLQLEEPVTILLPDFTEIPGTTDAVCGPVLFDLKWREFDYEAQTAAYALALLQKGHEKVTFHVCYGESKKARVYEWTLAEAEKVVFGIVERANDANKQPTPCNYCGWCARQASCPAMLATVNAIASKRPDMGLAELDTLVTEMITDPGQMARAYKAALVVEQWCKAVQHRAKEMAVKDGKCLPGYEVKTRQGNRQVTDIAGAFGALGLPQEKFLGTCKVGWTALVEAYAQENKIKKSGAEKEVEGKLAQFVERGAAVTMLVESK
jgi:hypothetical protein